MARGLVVTATLCLGCAKSTPPVTAESEGSVEPLEVAAPIEKHVLKNGLVVVLNEDRRVPIVAVRVTYRVGASTDPPGRTGMAHLLEHLLFHGTRHVPEDGFFRLLHAAGAGEVNGMTALDWTSYWQVVPAGNLPLALWLESERMAFGLEPISDAQLARERRIVELEEQERVDGAPNGKLGRFIGDELFPKGHPYARGDLGVSEATLADFRAFYQAHYGPNNAVLVVSGHFDGKATLRLIEHYFERVPPRAAPSSASYPMVSLNETRSIHVEARVEAPVIGISWPTPAYFDVGDAELDVIAIELQRRLRARLVDERAVAVNVSVRQFSAKLISTFQLWVVLKPDISPAAIVADIDDVLLELRRTGIAERAIRDCAFELLMNLYLDQDDVVHRSLFLTEHELGAQNPNFLRLSKDRYGNVHEGSVREALSKYLHINRRVVTIVTPHPGAPLAGKLQVRP